MSDKTNRDTKIIVEYLTTEVGSEIELIPYQQIGVLKGFLRWIKWKLLRRCYEHAWKNAMKQQVDVWLERKILGGADEMEAHFEEFIKQEFEN